MGKKKIIGIQQIGIGVEDVHEAWKWYRKHFGMDIKVFEEAAVAELMLPYTSGQKRERHAILAFNMQSGGGFEIWQHTGKKPEKIAFEAQVGDIGILVTKLKSQEPEKAFEKMKAQGLKVSQKLSKGPDGQSRFFVYDPYGNIFQIIKDDYLLDKTDAPNGGVVGAIIGVSNIEESLKVYQDILEYDQIVYDKTGVFDDLKELPGGDRKVRRLLLKHSKERTGGFAPLFGPTQIELVQWTEGKGRAIYEDRIWGDPGFIHICFDVIGMDALRKEVDEKGFPFTVDSADSFDMGEAAGHFAYISDPDGIPIEFVETHKVPIIKALNWNIDLRKRNPDKSLPLWMIKTMRWKRVK